MKFIFSKTAARFFTVLVLLPAIIVGSFYSLHRHGFFNLQNIDIDIVDNNPQSVYLHPLTEQMRVLLLQNKGQSLFHIDIQSVSAQLQQLEWVEKIHLSRHWPQSLHVSVQPKQIKFLYLSKSGKMQPLTAQGELLSPVTIQQLPDVTLLEGDVFEKNLELRKKAVQVIEQIPSEGRFSRQKISDMHFDSKEGFWATLIQSGVKVKIGDTQVPQKSVRVSQVLEYIDQHQLEARVIDTNLSKKVVVRLRKDP